MRTRIALVTAIVVTSMTSFTMSSIALPGLAGATTLHRHRHVVAHDHGRGHVRADVLAHARRHVPAGSLLAAEQIGPPSLIVGLHVRTGPVTGHRRSARHRRSTAGGGTAIWAQFAVDATSPSAATATVASAPAPAPAPPAPPAPAPPAPAPAPPPPPTNATSTNTADWQCIRVHESGDVYNAPTRPSGAYGILDSTWLSLGYSGWPYQATAAVQDRAALTLYDRYGWQPWSSRFACGL